MQAQQQQGAKVKRSQDVEEERAIKLRATGPEMDRAKKPPQDAGLMDSVSQLSNQFFGGGASNKPVKEHQRSGLNAPLGAAPRRRLPTKEEEEAAALTRKQRLAAEEAARKEAPIDPEAGMSSEERAAREQALAFIKAAQEGRANDCREMVQAGCPVNSTDDRGWTAMHAAADAGQLEMVEALLDLDDIEDDILDSRGRAALHVACESGQLEVLEFFIDIGLDVGMKAGKASKQRTPLMFAAANGRVDIIGALLHTDCDLIDGKDREGKTALDIASAAELMDAVSALEGAAEARRVATKKQKEESMQRKKHALQRTNTRMLLKQEKQFSLKSMLQAAQKQHQDQHQKGWDRLLRHAKESGEDKRSRVASVRTKLYKGFRKVSMAAGAIAHMGGGRHGSKTDATLVLTSGSPPPVRKSKSDQGLGKATFDVTVRA